ncbi:MAG: DUF6188 family protein [Edaphobacter sp.]
MNGQQLLKEGLIGFSCTSVVKAEFLWQFTFGKAQASLNLECPWRLLSNGSVAFGCDDHEQQFGLTYKIDGIKKSLELLSDSHVSLVEVRDGSGDLFITFENGVKLEAFNLSSGYEGWTLSLKNGGVVVAQGGGNIDIWNLS